MKKLMLVLMLLWGFMAQGQVPRTLVYEEATGTWCQYCPRGDYYADSLKKMYDNVIVIKVHGSDPLALEGYVDSAGLESYPTANIDRIKKKLGTNVWFEGYQVRNGEPTYVSVSVNPVYNSSTRHLTVNLEATFSKAYSGDYRFAAIVLESSIVGDNTAYNQANYYSGFSGYMGGFEKLPRSIPYYMIAYDNVPRKLLGNYSGDYGSLPSSISKGATYNYSYDWTIPDEFNPDNMKVVGLVIDASTGEIMNAAESDYLTGQTNLAPFLVSPPESEAYVNEFYTDAIAIHDADDHEVSVQFNNVPSWMKVTEFAPNYYRLEGTPDKEGKVTIEVVMSDQHGNNTNTSFTINVNPGFPSHWEMVGNSPVSGLRARQSDIAIGPDNTLYAAYVDYASNVIYVKQYQNGSWTNYGPPIGGINYDVSIAVDGNGIVHVAHNQIDNNMNIVGLVVKKLENNKWVQVADVVQQGPNNWPQLYFDHQNNPYVAYTAGNSSSPIYCFLAAIEAGYWLNLGFLIKENGLYPEAVFTSDDVPYVIWADYKDTFSVYVSRYNAKDMLWEIVGDQSLGRTGSYLALTIDKNDKIYAAFEDYYTGQLNVFTFDGNNWVKIGADILGGSVYGRVEAATDNKGNLYILSLEEERGNRVTVMKYNGSKWESVGPPRFSKGSAYYTELLIDKNQIPIACFTDEYYENKTVVMSYGKYTSVEPALKYENEITVYPNPSQGTFWIGVNDYIQSLEVYNMTGQLIYSRQIDKEMNQELMQVNLDVNQNGSYLIRLIGRKQVYTSTVQILK